jgi:hypothetical protein
MIVKLGMENAFLIQRIVLFTLTLHKKNMNGPSPPIPSPSEGDGWGGTSPWMRSDQIIKMNGSSNKINPS